MTKADAPDPPPDLRPAAVHPEPWHVRGSVMARAQSVPEVRRAIIELLTRYGASRAIIGKVALAVTEAATNVVQHAYPDRRLANALRYDADIEDGDLEVVITDHGDGLRDDHSSDGLGLGLRLIAAVSDDFAIKARPAGIEVWMRFILDTPA
jgi:anti-sigma regulatory factor (Ser/Thr protein kinase)